MKIFPVGDREEVSFSSYMWSVMVTGQNALQYNRVVKGFCVMHDLSKYKNVTYCENSSNLIVIHELMVQSEAWFVNTLNYLHDSWFEGVKKLVICEWEYPLPFTSLIQNSLDKMPPITTDFFNITTQSTL